jgi:Family of unknown function (DUF5706)
MVQLTGEQAVTSTEAPPPRSFPPNGIHLVRTAQTMTLQLSQMADQKASILMGATFVVFTVAIGQAGRTGMPIALSVLALFAFISALLAVMAVLPRTTPHGAAAGSNILFFGNFTRMSEDAFIAEMKQRLASDETMLETMLHDIHQNGMVLATRKYRFLALAYRSFIVGLTLTLIVFLVERAMVMGG